MSESARYWTAILYPEHLIDGWQYKIQDLLEVAYCYCIHDKDTLKDHKDELDLFTNCKDDLVLELDKSKSLIVSEAYKRKVHIHIIVAFANTTTYKHALKVLNRLYIDNSLKYVKQVINIRHIYDYLIHDTDKCREDGKHLYDRLERKEGNNFDIGAFEQISIAEKKKMLRELQLLIIKEGFTNFLDFYKYILSNLDDCYVDVADSYNGLLEKLTRGNYQKKSFDLEREIKKCK